MEHAHMSLEEGDKFYWDGWRSTVNYKGFTIAVISADEDMQIKVHLRYRNIEDTEVASLKMVMEAAAKEFGNQWRQ